ncbi:metal-dependent transcriptional regulator [Pedobacter sp. BS3]|nr:metal-dependent transcriptional regulator [Pedobacter sp. BS3]
MLSLTEENYLKSIFHLSDNGQTAVNTNHIANQLNTRASSVTDMLKKLADKSLINYQPYQGVTLTAEGRKKAISIVRRHRLWEVFLVDKLHFGWDEVHDIAEQLEHVQSDALTDRLADFLGNPVADPHGDLIPDKNGEFEQTKFIPVDQMSTGHTGIISGVSEHSVSFLQYLQKHDLVLGKHIALLETTGFDGSVTLLINQSKELTISKEAAKNILVL